METKSKERAKNMSLTPMMICIAVVGIAAVVGIVAFIVDVTCCINDCNDDSDDK